MATDVQLSEPWGADTGQSVEYSSNIPLSLLNMLGVCHWWSSCLLTGVAILSLFWVCFLCQGCETGNNCQNQKQIQKEQMGIKNPIIRGKTSVATCYWFLDRQNTDNRHKLRKNRHENVMFWQELKKWTGTVYTGVWPWGTLCPMSQWGVYCECALGSYPQFLNKLEPLNYMIKLSETILWLKTYFYSNDKFY